MSDMPTALAFLAVVTDRDNERVHRERAQRELGRCRKAREGDAAYIAGRIAERDAAQEIVWAVAKVRIWTNEDGREFVFADDLRNAMGVPRG